MTNELITGVICFLAGFGARDLARYISVRLRGRTTRHCEIA